MGCDVGHRVAQIGQVALRERGMTVDFNWDSGSAPRYLEMYRRAIDLRLEVAAP